MLNRILGKNTEPRLPPPGTEPRTVKRPHYTLKVYKGDITEHQADVLVTAANARLMGGGGVDAAIHDAAGPRLLRDLGRFKQAQQIDKLEAGEAVLTRAHDLTANGVKFVAHAVGPIYPRRPSPEKLAEVETQLADAYDSSLDAAERCGCKSIAFPSISTGVYGYPLAEAAPVALRAIDAFFSVPRSLEDVALVTFDYRTQHAYGASADALAGGTLQSAANDPPAAPQATAPRHQ